MCSVVQFYSTVQYNTAVQKRAGAHYSRIVQLYGTTVQDSTIVNTAPIYGTAITNMFWFYKYMI